MVVMGAVIAMMIGALVWPDALFIPGIPVNPGALLFGSIAAGSAVLLYHRTRSTEQSIQVGRERVRQAERAVEGALAGRSGDRSVAAEFVLRRVAEAAKNDADRRAEEELARVLAAERESRRDRDLTLASLWKLTHTRLELYHDIATTQAKRSFFTAQFSMVIGFGLLVLFVALALKVSNTAGAIAAGGLGAVSAALAGFISKTFVKSQQTAAEHLKAYFDQPLEFSRYLAAERLLADANLPEEKRVEIVAQLVQAIAAGPGAGEPVDAKGLVEQLQEMLPGQGS